MKFLLSLEAHSVYYQNKKQPLCAGFCLETGLISSSIQVPKWVSVLQNLASELQLSKANTSDTKAAFLDLHLSISNDIVSTKIYDKHDDLDFEIVNFPFLDGDVPRSRSYGVN